MPIADTKKVQTMVNVLAEQVVVVRSAISTMQSVRDIYLTVSPSTAGTCIDGQVTAINQALNALNSTVNSGSTAASWDLVVACYAPSHRKESLDGS